MDTSAFDDVFLIIRMVIGMLLLVTFLSVFSGQVVIPVTADCAAGASETAFMWIAFIFTICCICNAIFFATCGKVHLVRDKNLMADALPSKFLYLMLGFACSFAVFAIMATCATVFFLLEMSYMKFHCQPRAFQYTLPLIAIHVIVVCGVIIYQIWRTPHK